MPPCLISSWRTCVPCHAGCWAYDIMDWLLVMCVARLIHIISSCKTIVDIVKLLDLVGVDCLNIFFSYASSFAASSLAFPNSHGLILVWGGWMMVCYIGVVNKLDRLLASTLISFADSLPSALSLLLKHRFSFPLVLGQWQDIYGGCNPIYLLMRHVVHALRHIVFCLRMGLVVYYF